MLLYSILVLAAGVLLAGGTVFLILRRVGRRVLQAGLSLTAVVLLAAGGLLLAGELGSRTEARQELYLALRYLEDSQPEAAGIHLDQVPSSNPNPNQYLAAQSLLERARGNSTIAQLNLDLLSAQAGEGSELVRYLSAGSLSDSSQVNTAAGIPWAFPTGTRPAGIWPMGRKPAPWGWLSQKRQTGLSMKRYSARTQPKRCK